MTNSSNPWAEYVFCVGHSMGRSPISISGLGRVADSSEMRVPKPPARMTTFTLWSSPGVGWRDPDSRLYQQHAAVPEDADAHRYTVSHVVARADPIPHLRRSAHGGLCGHVRAPLA